jgi:hypothetical protein
MNGLQEFGGDMPGESAVRIQSRIHTVKNHKAIGVPMTCLLCIESRRSACDYACYRGLLGSGEQRFLF